MKTRLMAWVGRVVASATTLGVMVALGACTPPTAFEGEAQFPGGARGCFDRCAQDGMDMGSFVYVGEFSTACACKPRLTGGPASQAAEDEGAAVAGAAGVEVQRRRIEAQQRQSQASFGKPY